MATGKMSTSVKVAIGFGIVAIAGLSIWYFMDKAKKKEEAVKGSNLTNTTTQTIEKDKVGKAIDTAKKVVENLENIYKGTKTN